MNHTETARVHVGRYCQGRGVDIGCGLAKVTDGAIGIDWHHPYNRRQCTVETEADLEGPWERELAQFKGESLDFVYSSHLLEGYRDIEMPLGAWAYHVRAGGYIVLYLPIEELLAPALAHSPPPYYHVRQQAWSGSRDFVAKLPARVKEQLQVVEASELIPPCSFYVVLQKRSKRVESRGRRGVLRIDLDPGDDARWPDSDCTLFSIMGDHEYRPGDIRSYYSSSLSVPESSTGVPASLAETIVATLQRDVRALIGNNGCELSYRHVHGSDATRNVGSMLSWAQSAFDLVGKRLVLGPMDFDIIQDVVAGRRLLRWAAGHGVPLIVFCGYRFLHEEDAFQHIREVSEQHPFSAFGNPFHYPFPEVSLAIKHTGAEVWTGAGHIDGLRGGSLERAMEFGFSGVLTTREAWVGGLTGG